MGFRDYRVEIDDEKRRGLIFIYDNPTLVKDSLPSIVESINHIVHGVARTKRCDFVFFDVNNYRQERENLITELARAAAKKASSTGEDVSLPAMNSYERRLVHVALAVHPEVTTESAGASRDRHVVIRVIRDN